MEGAIHSCAALEVHREHHERTSVYSPSSLRLRPALQITTTDTACLVHIVSSHLRPAVTAGGRAAFGVAGTFGVEVGEVHEASSGAARS